VNEMNIDAVDLGDELRQGVEPSLYLAPVVFGRPIARELLCCRELNALRRIADSLPIRPSRRQHAPPEIDKLLLRHVDAKGTDDVSSGRSRQRRRKQACGTGDDDTHRSRTQKFAAILVDYLGGDVGVHDTLPDFNRNIWYEYAVSAGYTLRRLCWRTLYRGAGIALESLPFMLRATRMRSWSRFASRSA
jgi:hypothetical protein